MKKKTNITQLPSTKSTSDREEKSQVSSLSPREIVSELDRFVIGQKEAKRAETVKDMNKLQEWLRLRLNNNKIQIKEMPKD